MRSRNSWSQGRSGRRQTFHHAVLEEDEVVAVEEGAVGVVEDGEDGEVGVHKLADQAQEVGRVEEVEVGGRLVEEDEARLLRQDPGDADHLLLAARQLGVGPLPQVQDAHPPQGVDGDLQVLLLGRVRDVAGAPREDHVLHGEGEDRAVVLGQVAEDLGPPPGGEGEQLLAHDAHLAALELQHPPQDAHERRLAAAVLAQQDRELPLRDLQGDVVEDRPPFVGEGESVDLDRGP